MGTGQNSVDPARRRAIASYLETIQANGQLTFAARDVEPRKGTGRRAVEAALRRQALAGHIARVSRGFFVIVPPEYRSSGVPPVEWWLDDLMEHLQMPYYLGLLSAAEAHGSSHYAVMETQVVTERWLRPVEVGRVRIRFFQKVRIHRMPVDRRQNAWASLAVSAPEATVLDLTHRRVCGMSRTAAILSDLVGSFGERRLRAALEAADDTPAGQRCGYLLDHLGHAGFARVVGKWLVGRRPRRVSLEPGSSAAGPDDSRWRVTVNARLEMSP